MSRICFEVRSSTRCWCEHDDLACTPTGLPFSYCTVTWLLESGPQHLLLAGVAGFRDQAQDLVRVEDRRRHQIRRLVAGVTEHDALVAGAFFLIGARLQRVDALRDVGRLRMQQDLDLGGLPVEAVLLVADVLDGVARDLLDHVVGDGLADRASHRRCTTLLVVASVSQAARIAHGSMPAFGPSR